MASGNESRSDDSQASQLLAAALRPQELQPASPRPFQTDGSYPRNGSLQSSNDISVHYQMHGLVATQTQSLFSTADPPYSDGSQKENTPAAWEKGKTSPPPTFVSPTHPQLDLPSAVEVQRAPSPSVLSIKATKDNPRPKDSVLPTNDLHSTTKGIKAVPFASPSRPSPHLDRSSTLPSRIMPPPRVRSPSPASQDSFAGPLPRQDPVRAFLAKEKNFAIPLSQLGEDSQSQSNPDEDGPPPLSSTMWKSQRPHAVTRPTSSHEKVLVAGTPSSSSHDSRSQSLLNRSQLHLVGSQPVNGDTQTSDVPQAQPKDYDIDYSTLMEGSALEGGLDTTPPSPRGVSTEPSSSYERLLRQDPFEVEPEATQPANETLPTQLADETAPTQLLDFSTQASTSVDVRSIIHNHDFYNDSGQMVFPSAHSEVRSSNISRDTVPQRLRGLIGNKWHRYKDVMPPTGPSLFPRPPTRGAWEAPVHDTQPTASDISSSPVLMGETQPTEVETQPSNVAICGSTPSASPKRRLPPADRMLQVRRALRFPAPVDDSIDIVPDSEGPDVTQVVPDNHTPARGVLLSPSSAATNHSLTKPRRGNLQSEDEVLRAIVTSELSVPVVEEEHEEAAEEDDEEDEDEDDVPLAATTRSAKAQGKQKASTGHEEESSAIASPEVDKHRGGKASRSPDKGGIVRGSAVRQKSSSWKNAVIPSSDPRERHEDDDDPVPKMTKKSAKPRTPRNQAPLPVKTRSAPRAAKLAACERLHESSSEPEEEDEEEEDLGGYRSYQDGVPAAQDMDIDPPGPKPKRGNKRKRTISSSAKEAPSKTNGPKVKEEYSPALSRAPKRFKSSTPQTTSTSAPTRVFALWKNTARYFSGVVQQTIGVGRYLIHFDDSDEAQIDLKHVRACQLKEGDHVLIGEKNKATVIVVPEWTGTGHMGGDTITVEYVHGERENVCVQAIQIATRTALADWGDRMISEDVIVPVIRPKPARTSPTPSRLSVPSESSVRGAARRLLAKTGLVVTLSPKNPKWEHQKDELMGSIRRLGGVVLDDWKSVFEMEGKYEHKGSRWMLSGEDIRWKKRSDIDRVFLISDDHHQKPKFLIALALGIPCVSIQWLKDVVTEEDKDWPPYLLPSGFSDQLGARVSQMVDLDWGNSIQHLTKVTENFVAAKVFAEKSVLCISPEFLPARLKTKKNGNGGSKNEAAVEVPRIVLCMGAASVEAVADPKNASHNLEEYDFVVVRDHLEQYNDVEHCVDVSWVKDCLISGRLLRLPCH